MSEPKYLQEQLLNHCNHTITLSSAPFNSHCLYTNAVSPPYILFSALALLLPASSTPLMPSLLSCFILSTHSVAEACFFYFFSCCISFVPLFPSLPRMLSISLNLQPRLCFFSFPLLEYPSYILYSTHAICPSCPFSLPILSLLSTAVT